MTKRKRAKADENQSVSETVTIPVRVRISWNTHVPGAREFVLSQIHFYERNDGYHQTFGHYSLQTIDRKPKP